MPYRLRGTLDETARVLLFNEADMSLERSSIFEAGNWELLANSGDLKLVLAREVASGEALGFGAVTPEYYGLTTVLLAINTSDDFLAIDDSGNGLIVSQI